MFPQFEQEIFKTKISCRVTNGMMNGQLRFVEDLSALVIYMPLIPFTIRHVVSILGRTHRYLKLFSIRTEQNASHTLKGKT